IKGINRVTAIGPFSLSTTAMLLMSAKGFSKASLIERMTLLHDFFNWSNVNIYEKAKDPANFSVILDYVLASYHEDKIIEDLRFEDGQKLEDMFLLKEENRGRIAFYKNSIAHFLLGISYTSIGILACRKNGPEIKIPDIVEHFDYLKKLFSQEFIYPEEISDSQKAVHTAIEYLQKRGILSSSGDSITLREDHGGDLIFFGRAVQDMLESYLIVLDIINQNYKKKVLAKDMAVEVRKNGVKMYHLGKIKLAESLSVPNYKSATMKFINDGILAEEVLSRKNSLYTVKDQVSPRRIKDTIEQYLSQLA
ncbi:MAG: hypothetical protein ACRCUT_15315, partial [Spirochaetota bacterium]